MSENPTATILGFVFAVGGLTISLFVKGTNWLAMLFLGFMAGTIIGIFFDIVQRPQRLKKLEIVKQRVKQMNEQIQREMENEIIKNARKYR